MIRKAWIGADVGKLGAFAIIREFEDGYGISLIPIPMIGKGKGSEYDVPEMINILDEVGGKFDTKVLIEDVHSIFGASAGSNFQFGVGAGLLRGVVAALRLPFTLVAPKTWQEYCYEGVPIIEKQGTKAKGRSAYDRKAMSLVAVKRLYPHQNLMRTSRTTKPDEGFVDALLMAHYAKNKL